jgi:hypothetical protein
MSNFHFDLSLKLSQGEVIDFSVEVQKFPGEVQNDLRGGAHLPHVIKNVATTGKLELPQLDNSLLNFTVYFTFAPIISFQCLPILAWHTCTHEGYIPMFLA